MCGKGSSEILCDLQPSAKNTMIECLDEYYRMPGAFDDQILLAEIPDNVVEDKQLLHQDLQGAAHQEDPIQPLQPFPQEEELVHQLAGSPDLWGLKTKELLCVEVEEESFNDVDSEVEDEDDAIDQV